MSYKNKDTLRSFKKNERKKERNKKSILKSIQTISTNKPDLSGSHYLWGFTKEVNNKEYSLKKDYGFNLTLYQQEEDKVDISTKNFIPLIKDNFLKKDKNNGLFLPKTERHFQFSLTNFHYYLEKYFEVSEFRLEENLVDDEIFHFNVIEDEVKDFSIIYPSTSMNHNKRLNENVYSISILKKGDRIFVFTMTGIDYQTEFESVKNHILNRDKNYTFISDPFSFKRDVFPMISLFSFNWSDVKDINPDTNPKEFQNKLIDINLIHWIGVRGIKRVTKTYDDWYNVKLEDDDEWTPHFTHLKRWVWISSYFRYYRMIQRKSRSRVRSGSSKSWLRTNYIRSKKKIIPYEIVFTPKKVMTRLKKRYSYGCSLQERQIMGFWRNTPNPNTLGKNEYGERLIQGKTYVKPHTRMILMNSNIISVKKKII